MRLIPKALFALAVAAPWLWLMAFAALVGQVSLVVGHFPRFSHPDPKHAVEAEGFYAATVLLIGPAVISPLMLGLVALLRRAMRLKPPPAAWMLVNVAGLAAILALYFGDPLGLASWYLD